MIDIRKTITETTLTQFTRMEKLGDFGPGGRDRALQHFARIIAGMSAHDPLGMSVAQKFWPIVREKQKALGLADLSEEELKTREKSAFVEIDRKPVNLDEPDQINAALKKEKSNLRLVSGWSGAYRVLILAEATEDHRNGFEVTTLGREIARTPTAIFPMAAMVGGQQIAIRTEAIEHISWTKWGMGHDPEGDPSPAAAPEKNIRHLLKQATLKLYGIGSTRDYATKEKLVVHELVETTLLHELGHAVILNNELTAEERKILEDKEPMDGTPLSIINEALAEWLPPRGETYGPLFHMAVLAEQGEAEKATRLFYRYLSDSWFFGNPEELYLTAQTEVIVGGMAKFVRPDGSVDFPRLKSECEKIFGEYVALLKERLKNVSDDSGHEVSIKPHRQSGEELNALLAPAASAITS